MRAALFSAGGRWMPPMAWLDRLDISHRIKVHSLLSRAARWKSISKARLLPASPPLTPNVTRPSYNNSPAAATLSGTSTSSGYPSPEHSPQASLDTPPFDKRLQHFIALHSKFYKASLQQKRLERRERFKTETRTRRNQMFNLNRGLWLCGEALFWGGGKPNLGNDLQICEGRFSALDKDKDQSYPTHLENSDTLQWVKPKPVAKKDSLTLPLVPLKIHTIRGSAGLDGASIYLKTAFAEADVLVRNTFADRGIVADLSRVVESGFTCDLAIKQGFHQVSPEKLLHAGTPGDAANDLVLGACLFVMMKKFIWIEEIAVGVKGMGVGSVMIERLKAVARVKQKDLLLYAILEAVPFYQQHHGFKPIKRWETSSKYHPGEYLSWSVD